MNKQYKMMIKMAAFVSIIAMSLLAGCSLNTPLDLNVASLLSTPSSVSAVSLTSSTSNVCRVTGDPLKWYQEISVTSAELNKDCICLNYIVPAPVNGCPTSPLVVTDGKIAIYHATGSATRPYERILVSISGLDGHGLHAGDIIGELASGSPTSPLVIVDGKTAICHATGSETNPYNKITVSVNGLNGHDKHESDIIPAPTGDCPTSRVITSKDDGKMAICHATGSGTNPYEKITVSVNGLNGHDKHEGDIIPAPMGNCPTSPVTTRDGKITICHATSSETNPYNEITVSLNGLNGHGNHEGDIIPVPGGGCPITGTGKK